MLGSPGDTGWAFLRIEQMRLKRVRILINHL